MIKSQVNDFDESNDVQWNESKEGRHSYDLLQPFTSSHDKPTYHPWSSSQTNSQKMVGSSEEFHTYSLVPVPPSLESNSAAIPSASAAPISPVYTFSKPAGDTIGVGDDEVLVDSAEVYLTSYDDPTCEKFDTIIEFLLFPKTKFHAVCNQKLKRLSNTFPLAEQLILRGVGVYVPLVGTIKRRGGGSKGTVKSQAVTALAI